MHIRIALLISLGMTTLFVGAETAQLDTCAKVPNVLTADIQNGIETYIEKQTRLGNGYFNFSAGDTNLSLMLVRVHTEYLANLGPRRHFACVDLVDVSGDVYDVDFFLEGDPGDMRITETTLHKLNGKPFYAWKQQEDGTWTHVPPDEASQQLLGVITGQDEFEFIYQTTLPILTNNARMWIPYPASDDFQEIKPRIVKAPGQHRLLEDPLHGNKILFFELGPEDSEKMVDIRYHVQRLEKAAYASKIVDPKQYLNPDRLRPSDENFKAIAEKAVVGKKGDLVRARALYDHVIDHMKYIKVGEGWGQGDAVYACDAQTGNCTDFHAYFIALARSIDIPARFAIGAAIPSARNDGGVDGYHCWVEFYAEDKWWPVDISEADKYSGLSTYYFGHHPANRIELSRGRDLVLAPGPASGPINFLAYPVLEINRQSRTLPVKFSFSRPVGKDLPL